MVTTSVTYLEGSERCFVAHGEVVGVTHKGSDQAPLYGRRAGRGVRSQQAHDAQGPKRAFGDGGAFALHTGSWGRVLPAAGRQEALPFFERGRGARPDRLLRGATQVPRAPLLDAKSLCRDQAQGSLAQGGRGRARQAEEARLRGRASARLRGPAPGRAASGGARRDTPEGYLRLDQVGDHRADDLPVRPVRLARVLVLRLLRPQKGDECPDEGGTFPLGREGRGLRTTTGALRPGLDEHCAGGVQRAALGEVSGHRAGRKSFELTSLFGRIAPEEDGVIEVEIPLSEIDYYASRLLSGGTDIRVDSPQELVEAIENKAGEIVHLYRPQTS